MRAVHLHELLGTPLDEGTSGDVLGGEFLMHIMEVREELEEAAKEANKTREQGEECDGGEADETAERCWKRGPC